MPAPTAPPVVGPFPTPAPTRTDPSTFSARGDAYNGHFNTDITDKNALATWQNNTAADVFSDATAANNSAVAAADSEAISASNANFVGLWSAQTGAANVPYSVSHNGSNWQLLNNLADVTASEPGITGDWQEIITAPTISELHAIALYF